MAIVKVGGTSDGGLERRVGLKAAKKAAKKSAEHSLEKHAAQKHPAKKHPAKKHPAKKHAEKHPGKKAAKKAVKKSAGHAGGSSNLSPELLTASKTSAATSADLLSHAFHHLQRAAALISLLEPDSGGDLRLLLDHGVRLYRNVSSGEPSAAAVRSAWGLLRAAESLAMAGFWLARADFRLKVSAPDAEPVAQRAASLSSRLDSLHSPAGAKRIVEMARELLRRVQKGDERDPHLDHELMVAAEGLYEALKAGILDS